MELVFSTKERIVMNQLTLTSPDFQDGGWIPLKHTGRGEDLSPCLELHGLAKESKALAVILEDASHPLFKNYTHWLIWNLPPRPLIPAGISAGKTAPDLEGAVQGIAYGRHRYRGPKPPLQCNHTYVFTVFALDCRLELSPFSRKSGLLHKMEGHILQSASLSGQFQSRR